MSHEKIDKLVSDAYHAFDKWVKEHDPDGEMEILEQIEAYSKWWKKQQEEKDNVD